MRKKDAKKNRKKALKYTLAFVLCVLMIPISVATAEGFPMEGEITVEDGTATIRLRAKEAFGCSGLLSRVDLDSLPAGVEYKGVFIGADTRSDSGYNMPTYVTVYQETGVVSGISGDGSTDTQVPAGAEFAIYLFDVSRASAEPISIQFTWQAIDAAGEQLPWGDGREAMTVSFTKAGEMAAPAGDGTHMVQFETNSSITVDSVAVDAGEATGLPEIEQEGYIFEGWYTDEGLTQPASSAFYQPQGNETLYAKWKPVSDSEFVVKFHVDGGERITPMGVEKGKQIQPPVPVRAGYQFEGWYQDEALTEAVGDNYTPSSDATLFAKWSMLGGEALSSDVGMDGTEVSSFPVLPVVIVAVVVVAAVICTVVLLTLRKKKQ